MNKKKAKSDALKILADPSAYEEDWLRASVLVPEEKSLPSQPDAGFLSWLSAMHLTFLLESRSQLLSLHERPSKKSRRNHFLIICSNSLSVVSRRSMSCLGRAPCLRSFRVNRLLSTHQ